MAAAPAIYTLHSTAPAYQKFRVLVSARDATTTTYIVHAFFQPWVGPGVKWQSRRVGNVISFASLQHKRSSDDRETCQFLSRVHQLDRWRSNEGVEEGQKIRHRALFLFHSTICSGGAFISESLSCNSEVHTSAQRFVILKMRFFSSGSTSVCYKQRRTSVPRPLSFWTLKLDEKVGCLPVTFVCASEYSNHNIICGQP